MHTQSKFRLLVVRLGAMGDILHALPAVTALRKIHSEWIIDWVVEPRWCALLTASGVPGRDTGQPAPKQPLVDRIHFAPAKQWGKSPLAGQTIREFMALRRALREAKYDAAIDFQGAVRSAVFGRLAEGRLIGEAAPREWAARWLFTDRVTTRGAHVIEQDFELASAVAGDVLKPVRPWLPFDLGAEAWADGLLASSRGQRAVLINPGAGWGAKRWPVERYATVAQGLVGRGCRVLVNAGPGEEQIADVIVSRTNGVATPLAPSLENLIALTRRVALVIAGDTGPLHLACALGKPVVGIYGPTDPRRNGPFGTQFKVLRSPASRRDHSRRKIPEAGLLTIQPDEVLSAAEELLYATAAL
ncbi:MAG: glycosyltransferase family 9 protein [Terracidiphilus sp.]